jgi:DNA gyrase subunit A
MAEKKDNDKVVHIEDQMKSDYLAYSLSVIVGRAIADYRDGLKPAQRRILYTLNNLAENKLYKSARVVGDVLGRLHP